ncbi:MAG: hypothetical protein KatS3mg110_0049 [Pirellulaceae bacterium]|nr:MAG: hypothetical protein KatS3mg110_0049 [Pirellulaceae bacterium]
MSKDYTPYQQRVIRNYYDNRQAVALQRASELVTELYLSEGKRRQQHWKHLASHLEALGVKPAQIAHLMEQDKPELVAKLLKQLARSLG